MGRTDSEQIIADADQAFGQFLVDAGWATPDLVKEALVKQANRNLRLGELARANDWLTIEKIYNIVEYQRVTKARFGEAAVALGYLSNPELNDLLERQSNLYHPLEDILVELGAMTPEQAVEARESYRKKCPPAAG